MPSLVVTAGAARRVSVRPAGGRRSASTAPTATLIDTLCHWLESHNVSLRLARPQIYRGMGLGISAAAPISAGQTVLHVPSSCWHSLSAAAARDALTGNSATGSSATAAANADALAAALGSVQKVGGTLPHATPPYPTLPHPDSTPPHPDSTLPHPTPP